MGSGRVAWFVKVDTVPSTGHVVKLTPDYLKASTKQWSLNNTLIGPAISSGVGKVAAREVGPLDSHGYI